MGFIIPFEDTDVGFRQNIKAQALTLFETALREVGGKRPEEYIVRSIMPGDDLGFSNNQWSISYTAANVFENKVNKQLDVDTFVVLFGYENLSAVPKTIAFRIFRDTKPLAQIQVEELYIYNETPVGFFTPVVIKERETLKVDFMGNATGTDKPVLRGYILEKKDATVAGPTLDELLRVARRR
jgi:hypothetical protein